MKTTTKMNGTDNMIMEGVATTPSQPTIPAATSPLVFESPSDIAPFAYQLYKKRVPRKKTEKIIKSAEFKFDTSNLDIPAIITLVIQQVYSGEAYKGEEKTISISSQEKGVIVNFATENPSPLVKHPEAVKNLLIAYLANSRYDDHESGWVYYNMKRVFTEAGLQKLTTKEKNELVNFLITKDIIKLKVVGKKNPKLCYKLEWRDEIMADATSADCLITMGPDYSAKAFLEQIKNIF